MSAENRKTPLPGSSSELNLESTTYTFTLTADPLTPSGNVRKLQTPRHNKVEEEEETTKVEVEEVAEEEELEEVAAMAP